MPADPSRKHAKPTMIEIKGGSFTLPMIKLLGTDMDAVGDQLAEKIEQAPDFFRNTPVVIDLQELTRQKAAIDLPLLLSVLRGRGVVPIGIQGARESQLEAARAMDLAILSDGKVELKPVKSEVPRKPEENREPAPSVMPTAKERTTRLINQPVRSGQRIYAGGSDLIVLAQVSNGAEIMADGNIHVYGTLHGRALAGAKGNTECRIFCMNLEAELISIAGHYQISERLDDALRGKPVQIYLDDEKSLIIDDL